MIELLIVFALAIVGVYFTTTSSDSFERPHADEDYFADGATEDEDEGGIGILGIDVGRKMKHVRKARMAARERVAKLRQPRTEAAPEAPVVMDEADTDKAIRSILTEGEDSPAEQAVAPLLSDDYDYDYEDEAEGEVDPAELTATVAAARAAEPVSAEADEDARDDQLAAADHTDDAPQEAEAEDTTFDDAISAAIRAELAEQNAYRAQSAQASERDDYAGPPVIDDFDPEEDQIVIGYYPSEAGDGRIGITEDPTSPGTARVTLGGKVVALVPGGYGLVQAYHIELRLLEDDAA